MSKNKWMAALAAGWIFGVVTAPVAFGSGSYVASPFKKKKAAEGAAAEATPTPTPTATTVAPPPKGAKTGKK